MINKKVIFQNLGIVDYKETWEYQEILFKKNIDIKLQNRIINCDLSTNNYLLICEHPHVYTLGKSGKENNLLINEEFLKNINAKYYKINRGGDITYHGPGQIVGYPIFDLENFKPDIHNYMRNLEEVIIRTLANINIISSRLSGATGVWIEPDNPIKARKICAMGVKASRWVTMHGFALNYETDLKYFNHINPCGFIDKGVTSIKNELSNYPNKEYIINLLKKHFVEVFELEFI